MDKIVIINGSHRAPMSNSRRYTKYLIKYLKKGSEELLLNKNNYDEISKQLYSSKKAVFVFPLYMDSPPAIFLDFLNRLEKLGEKYKNRPMIYLIVNCGFIENEQNQVAIRIMSYYLRKNGFPFGGALSIGSGEAILDSPFRFMVTRKIKKLAKAMDMEQTIFLKTQMSISKKFFVRAGNRYWSMKGAAQGKTKTEMQTMDIQ